MEAFKAQNAADMNSYILYSCNLPPEGNEMVWLQRSHFLSLSCGKRTCWYMFHMSAQKAHVMELISSQR